MIRSASTLTPIFMIMGFGCIALNALITELAWGFLIMSVIFLVTALYLVMKIKESKKLSQNESKLD